MIILYKHCHLLFLYSFFQTSFKIVLKRCILVYFILSILLFRYFKGGQGITYKQYFYYVFGSCYIKTSSVFIQSMFYNVNDVNFGNFIKCIHFLYFILFYFSVGECRLSYMLLTLHIIGCLL